MIYTKQVAPDIIPDLYPEQPANWINRFYHPGF
jgi:hypothetical protein